MHIIITNIETGQYIGTVTDAEFMQMCGNDQRMYDDYLNKLRKNPKVRTKKEIWKVIE